MIEISYFYAKPENYVISILDHKFECTIGEFKIFVVSLNPNKRSFLEQKDVDEDVMMLIHPMCLRL